MGLLGQAAVLLLVRNVLWGLWGGDGLDYCRALRAWCEIKEKISLFGEKPRKWNNDIISICVS